MLIEDYTSLRGCGVFNHSTANLIEGSVKVHYLRHVAVAMRKFTIPLRQPPKATGVVQHGLFGGEGIASSEWERTHEIAQQRMCAAMTKGQDIAASRAGFRCGVERHSPFGELMLKTNSAKPELANQSYRFTFH
jgi:hypothetical protein